MDETTPNKQTPREAAEQLYRSYLDKGVPENTKKAYDLAIRHFQFTWGGRLPASEHDVGLYIASYAQTNKVATIRLRLAALSNWHSLQGFTDPTKGHNVVAVLNGIRRTHTEARTQAKPLTLGAIAAIVKSLNERHSLAIQSDDFRTALRCTRDKAILLVGFWRAFRSDELSNMNAENVQFKLGVEMKITLAHSKTDSKGLGRTYQVPALRGICPVQAYADWLVDSGINKGPVFVRVPASGPIGRTRLQPKSYIELLRRLAREAGLNEDGISSHSLRRGFCHWAGSAGWTAKGIMEYVGWKDVRNAALYMPAEHSFGDLALDARAMLYGHGEEKLVLAIREPSETAIPALPEGFV